MFKVKMSRDQMLFKGMRFVKIVFFLLSAIFAGYTVMDLEPAFLEIMTDIRAQFFVNFILTASFFDFTFKDPGKDIKEILLITSIFTFMLHALRRQYVKGKKVDGDGVETRESKDKTEQSPQIDINTPGSLL